MERLKKLILKMLWILPLSIVLTGCFSDGNGNKTVEAAVEGIFIDSTVEGINYTADSLSGVTGRWGEFLYIPGETVTFSIADILLGETVGMPRVTPIDLVPFASPDANTRITNVAWLLQGLDSDGNPINGITISDSARLTALGQTFDFDMPVEDFSNNMVIQSFLRSGRPSVGFLAIPLPAEALSHLDEGVAGFLPYGAIDQGFISGVTTEQQVVIDNQKSWEDFWLQHRGNLPPEMDFTRDIVLAVSLGERPSFSYSIEISSIRDMGDEIVVSIYSRSPGPNEDYVDQLAHPYDIVATKRWGKPIRFDLDTSDNTLLTQKESCLVDGGLFGHFGLIQMNRCNRVTQDAGTVCTDYADCESLCLADEAVEVEGEITGTCYPWSIPAGCFENNIFDGQIGFFCFD